MAAKNESLIPEFSDAGDGAVSSQNLHKYSDVDLGVEAQHHTLGTGPTQAAAGSHVHTDRYAPISHEHDAVDIPVVDVPDEVVTSDVDPTIANPDLSVGTIWLNPTEVDADIEVVVATDDGVTAWTCSSTSWIEHPTDYGKIAYTPPVDGVMMVFGSYKLNDASLTGGAGGLKMYTWLRVYDVEAATYIDNGTGQSHTEGGGIQYRLAFCSALVEAGKTYYVHLRNRRDSATSGSFDISDFDFNIVFFPSGQTLSLEYET